MEDETDSIVKRAHIAKGDTPGKSNPKYGRFTEDESGNKPLPQRRRSLFKNEDVLPTETLVAHSVKAANWKNEELEAIVQYIALYKPSFDDDHWPAIRDGAFWEQCAKAVHQYSGQPLRTGAAIRTKTLKYLAKEFSTVTDAENFYDIDYFHSKSLLTECSTQNDGWENVNKSQGDIIQELISAFKCKLTKRMQEQMINQLVQIWIAQHYGTDFYNYMSKDFLPLAVKGMNALKENNKKNLFLAMSKCFGEEINGKSRMNVNQMPFGLISYNLQFFASDHTANIKMENDYLEWQTTMYAQFGHKWACLHRGPAWQYDQDDSGSDCEPATDGNDNVPADNLNSSFETGFISEYQSSGNVDLIQLALEDCEIDLQAEDSEADTVCDPDICALTEGVSKVAITTDVARTDMSLLWSSNVAERNEELAYAVDKPEEVEKYFKVRPTRHRRKLNKHIYCPYKAKINIAGAGVRHLKRMVQKKGFSRSTIIQKKLLKEAHERSPKGRWWIKADACDLRKGLCESLRGEWSGDKDTGDGEVKKIHDEYRTKEKRVKNLQVGSDNFLKTLLNVKKDLECDISFLQKGLKNATEIYNKKVDSRNVSQDNLVALAWDVTGYSELVKINGELISKICLLQEDQNLTTVVSWNNLRDKLCNYLKQLYFRKREPASHLMVFMIADEHREFKPYAIPVRVLPVTTVTDNDMRHLRDQLVDAMEELGMIVVGFVTDGEWNSLRTRGGHRAVSIIQIAMDARKLAQSTKVVDLDKFFKPTESNGKPEIAHDAIPPQSDIAWLYDFMENGDPNRKIPFNEAIHVMRRRMYPKNYDPCPWTPGKSETYADCLRSLFASYVFKQSVQSLKAEGVDFESHLYQPEISSVTGEAMLNREDHGHVFKRFTQCLRSGSIPGINMKAFADALNDPKSGLTYEALTGKNKQSIPDCERMFSIGVLKYMERHGHVAEAQLVQMVLDWHKAFDGRGITMQQRVLNCKRVLSWLLEDWMPWHSNNPDFSTLDINRPIKGIRGLTREVVVALVANLEGFILRALDYTTRGIKHANPRSGTSDDVEGLFSTIREMIGQEFGMKQFYESYPKILAEFEKKMNPELPFYYWTGCHLRYRDIPLPDFDQPGSCDVERLDYVRISRRADPGVFASNRASMPQHKSLTVRAKFHKAPEILPPTQFE